MSKKNYRVAVLPGDGIGPEVMRPCIAILDAATRRCGGPPVAYHWLDAGAGTYLSEGSALPERTLSACREADAILLGAMGLPHVRYPDGTEVAPQLDLRTQLSLYAGVRPIRSIPGVPAVLRSPQAAQIDFVIIRESTEGLFASRGKGTLHEDREARDTLVITREASERLFDYALRLGRERRGMGRPGRVTCVDKANVFTSLAFFRRIFEERAEAFEDVETGSMYIDAAALVMVLRPWDLDVLVTENMFGDILSDLGAGLVGGMGYAPSADIGAEHAVFQPCHGTAPDIAGLGTANPTAMILSAALMMSWLGTRYGVRETTAAARLITAATDEAFSSGKLVTCELGGDAGTAAVADAIMDALERLPTGADSVGRGHQLVMERLTG